MRAITKLATATQIVDRFFAIANNLQRIGDAGGSPGAFEKNNIVVAVVSDEDHSINLRNH
jgi:hypothetical protein